MLQSAAEFIRSNKRGAAVIALALAAVTINGVVSWIAGEKPAQAQTAAQTSQNEPAQTNRHYEVRFLPSGSPYHIYDSCAVEHENAGPRVIHIQMSLADIQRMAQCEGEVISETRLPGTAFYQKVVAFRGKDPHDTFFVTMDRNRVVGVDRRF
jgi:hypothetical protein